MASREPLTNLRMNPPAVDCCGIIRAVGRRGLCAVRWAGNQVENQKVSITSLAEDWSRIAWATKEPT